MEPSTQVIGFKIFKMEKELINGQMVTLMRVNLEVGKKQVMASLFGMITVVMKEHGFKT